MPTPPDNPTPAAVPPPRNEDLTLLLNAAGKGDSAAASQLLPMVYEELRELARRRMAKEAGGGAGMTMQATALVHEAYLRLVKETDVQWNGRNHFFSAAAIAMRRILVERARAHKGAKRGGGRARVDLNEEAGAVDAPEMDWVGLDEALKELEAHDARLAEVVMLRFFAGLSVDNAAEVLGISSRQVKREWAVARAWLYSKMTGEASPGAGERAT
jgi:RNA polymerase sigma factor (TIGR02999 family)